MSGKRVYRATAPVRLDFAGGWTDVAPFATERGGVVVNAAIGLKVQVEVEPGGPHHRIDCEDLGRKAELQGGAWAPEQASELALHRAALRGFAADPCLLRTRSEVPPGSGLGSSGALGVGLVAALEAQRGVSRTPAELAEAAFQLEAVDAGLPGGKQDQYAAALGGFQRLGFASERVTQEPLRLDSEFLESLARHTVICYTGSSRVSSNTISRVMGAYAAADPAVVGALNAMVELAERMAEALQAADLARVGRLLTSNWRCQQRLDQGMRTSEMARLEAAMADAGSLGGKAAGAGAGGSMFFLVEDPERGARAASEAGARVLPCTWAPTGVRSELLQ